MKKQFDSFFKKHKRKAHFLFRFGLSFGAGFTLSVLFTEFAFFREKIVELGIVDFLIRNLLIQTNIFLEQFGFDTVITGNTITTSGLPGIKYVFGCTGIREMAFFLGFMLTYPGKLLSKLWYIPLGFIALMTLNSFRGSMLLVTQLCCWKYFEFTHQSLTALLLYSGILFLWIFWYA